MQYKKIVLVPALCLMALISAAQGPVAGAVHLGILTPLSTQGRYAKELSPAFSLQALQGVNQHNKGLAVAGLYTRLYGNNKGLLISGLANRVKGAEKGLAVAGLYNEAANGRGVQVAGLHNEKRGNGFIQVAGLSNRSRYEVLQITGLVNVSEAATTQIAGLVNMAGSVKGVQIAGLVNIADHCYHPIGLINIIKNGEQQIGLQVYDDAAVNLVLRTGGRKTYGIVGLGACNESGKAVLQMEAGLGYHIRLSDPFRLNAEVVALSKTDFIFFKHTQSLSTLLAYRLNPLLELTAGPALYTYKYSDSKIFGNNHVWRAQEDVSSFLITAGALVGAHINL